MSFFIVSEGVKDGALVSDGRTSTQWMNSTLVFSLIVNLVCFKLFIETKQVNIMSIIAGVISLIVYYITLAILSTSGMSSIF